MTFREEIYKVSEEITADYATSWRIGIWFVIPFALTGFVLEVVLETSFQKAAMVALFVAASFVLIRIRFEDRGADDAESTTPNRDRTRVEEGYSARVTGFIEALRDATSTERAAAAQALATLGPWAVEAVPALIEACRDSSRYVRVSIAEALAKIGPRAGAALPTLTQVALRDLDRDVRYAAARALAQISPLAEAAVPGLIEALQNPELNMRHAAVTALAEIGPRVEAAAVPALTQVALRDLDLDLRYAAARALAQIGSHAKAAVPVLEHALRGSDSSVYHAAATALAEIGPRVDDAVPVLAMTAFHGQTSAEREAATEGILRLGLDVGLDEGLLRDLLPATTIRQSSGTVSRMTREELSASIGQLTTAELNRIHRYAAWRLTKLGWRAEGWTADDALNEAIVATLDGRRAWNPDQVDLCRHLMMTIRSQSWARQKKKSVVELLNASVLEDSEGNSRFEAMTSEEPAVEAAVMLDQILGSLEGDPEAYEVAKLLVQEMTTSEICDELGLTTSHYWAVMRRVRAVVTRLTGR